VATVHHTMIDIGGPVRIADFGGEGPLLLLVHGIGGSTENWDAAGPLLTDAGHVVAVDLIGFGDSEPAGRTPGVEDNALLVVEVIRHLGYDSATLVGNSMGGLISMIAAVARPEVIDGLVLVDPALPVSRRRPPDLEVLTKLIGPLLPGIGAQAFRIYRASHSPEEETAETLRMVTADPNTVPVATRERLTEANRRRRDSDWAIPAFLDADRSIAAYILRPRRFKNLVHRVAVPTLLIHGSEDRLVSVDSARWAAKQRPDWTFVEMDGIGHVPMLEAPEAFAAIVTGWLDAPG